MSVQHKDNFGPRGGHLAIVLRCPRIVADDHLVYFDFNKLSKHWVIRDFIAKQRLDNDHSHLTAQQILDDANYSEAPPWLNVERYPAEWRSYLEHRTTAVRRMTGSLGGTKPPNSASGTWQPLRF
jgi:hypothetical protein